jgi:hypothetical protein
MAKISKRMKKALALGLGVAALGRMGSASGIAGDKMATARKLMTSDTAVKGSAKKFAGAEGPLRGAAATAKASTKTGPGIKITEAMKDKNLQNFQDSITRLKERRGQGAVMSKVTSDSKTPGFFGFKFDKPLFKSGGSVMAKCKMGRNKKTKIY